MYRPISLYNAKYTGMQNESSGSGAEASTRTIAQHLAGKR